MADLAAEIEDIREAAREGRFFDVANTAQRVLELHPECLPALRALAWAQLEISDPAAFETFQHCAVVDPEDSLAEVGQAIWHERQGHMDRAVTKFTLAWERDPHDQNLRKEVVRLGGDFPESPLAEGIGLMQEGRYDPAATALRQAAAAQPADPAAPIALATALWHLGGKQQAYNLASTVLASRPHCVKAIFFVLVVESASGRLLRTRELIGRAEQVDPGFKLYGHVIKELGLEPVLERHYAGRQPSGYGR